MQQVLATWEKALSNGILKALSRTNKRRLCCIAGGGYRSVLVADALQQMGYTHVVSLAGGIRALRDAGFPLEKDKSI